MLSKPIIILAFIVTLNSIFSDLYAQPVLNSDFEQELVLLSRTERNFFYRLTIYNNCDSVLYILTSVSGNYKKYFVDKLSPISAFSDSIVYSLDYLSSDTLTTSFLPIFNRIGILPYQAKIVDLVIPLSSNNSFLRIKYYYDRNATFSTKKLKRLKPMWFKDLDIRSRYRQIDFRQ